MNGFHPDLVHQQAHFEQADLRRAAGRRRAGRPNRVPLRHWFTSVFVR
jgi:hypothetical protein